MHGLATIVFAGLVVTAACSDQRKMIDAAPATVCDSCRTDQLCVASYDGTCKSAGPRCVARTVDCPNNACSPACETAYCNAPYQCQNRPPCGGEPPGAFTCYGP